LWAMGARPPPNRPVSPPSTVFVKIFTLFPSTNSTSGRGEKGEVRDGARSLGFRCAGSNLSPLPSPVVFRYDWANARRQRYHDNRRRPDGTVRCLLRRDARGLLPPDRQPRSSRRPAHGALPGEVHLRRRGLPQDPRQGPREGNGRAGAAVEGAGPPRPEGHWAAARVGER